MCMVGTSGVLADGISHNRVNEGCRRQRSVLRLMSWSLTVTILLILCHCPRAGEESSPGADNCSVRSRDRHFLSRRFPWASSDWFLSDLSVSVSLSRKLFCQPLHHGRREVRLDSPRRLPVRREQRSELPGEQTSGGKGVPCLLPRGAERPLPTGSHASVCAHWFSGVCSLV